MNFIVAQIVFFYFYQIWYLGVCAVIKLLLDLVLPEGGLGEIPLLNLVYGGLVIFAFVVASRRSYHAARAYGNQDLSFLEAHQVAGALIRTDLAFLPIVGHLFGGERDRD